MAVFLREEPEASNCMMGFATCAFIASEPASPYMALYCEPGQLCNELHDDDVHASTWAAEE